MTLAQSRESVPDIAKSARQLAAGRQINFLFWTSVAFAVCLASGLALIPISGAIIVPGTALPESRIKPVSHPLGGVVSKIFVTEGQRVASGTPLVQFEATISELSADLAARSLDQLYAQRARLGAEFYGRSTMSGYLGALEQAGGTTRRIWEEERRRFALNGIEREAASQQLAAAIAQRERQIEGDTQQIAALKEQRALIIPELEGLRALRSQGYVTVRRVNEMERLAIELNRQIADYGSNIAQARATIAQIMEQKAQAQQTARLEAGRQLAEVEAAIIDKRLTKADADDKFKRSLVTAPHDGVIMGLEFNGVGAVVRPAERILSIVPNRDQLLFQGQVPVADIDMVRVGQVTRVRLTAFNSATTPELQARVVYISPSATTDPNGGQGHYVIRVVLDQESQVLAKKLRLVAGMPAEMFVQSGTRSMLNYIVKPMRDQINRAFRQ